MSEDQFQRQVDFIVSQQAKFETSIGRLEENLAELGKHTKENTQNIAKLGELILSLANYNQGQDEQIAALIQAGKETDRRFRETDERMKETDERISILIKVVERFYNRNGDD
jgi:septal ring factor EnvC (AmiA/AmiB activator)